MKPRLWVSISAALCAGCTEPSAPPPQPAAAAGPADSSPAEEVAKLYNDFRHRLPCPEQATCGTSPPLPVTAVRCRPSPTPDEARCIFLVAASTEANDQTYACEGAFDRRDGAWRMTDLVEPCRLVSERAHRRFRLGRDPDRRTIEEVESGFALEEALLAGGVADLDAAKAGSRVKVRTVDCWPWDGSVLCSYEASLCLDGETDRDGDGWCRRKARFVIGLGNSLTVGRGWTIDRPAKRR